MSLSHEIAEARAAALVLRASATACGSEQDALKVRLVRAADTLNGLVLLCVRAFERIAQLEAQLGLKPTGRDGSP